MMHKYSVGDLVLCNLRPSIPVNGKCDDDIAQGIIIELKPRPEPSWHSTSSMIYQYTVMILKHACSTRDRSLQSIYENRIVDLLSMAQQRKI